MAEQWDRDPKTGDYIMTGGAPKLTAENDLRIPAYHRLKIQRRRWLHAPDSSYGSSLADVKKNSSGAVQLTQTLAEQALAPIVEDKRATTATAEVTDQTRDGIAFTASLVDANDHVQSIDLPGIN